VVVAILRDASLRDAPQDDGGVCCQERVPKPQASS
jgi:hypothetical protein